MSRLNNSNPPVIAPGLEQLDIKKWFRKHNNVIDDLEDHKKALRRSISLKRIRPIIAESRDNLSGIFSSEKRLPDLQDYSEKKSSLLALFEHNRDRDSSRLLKYHGQSDFFPLTQKTANSYRLRSKNIQKYRRDRGVLVGSFVELPKSSLFDALKQNIKNSTNLPVLKGDYVGVKIRIKASKKHNIPKKSTEEILNIIRHGGGKNEYNCELVKAYFAGNLKRDFVELDKKLINIIDIHSFRERKEYNDN